MKYENYFSLINNLLNIFYWNVLFVCFCLGFFICWFMGGFLGFFNIYIDYIFFVLFVDKDLEIYLDILL